MKELEKGLLLYHGSYCSVESPDLEKCALYKDFGRGFYLTSSKDQARNFAKISAFRQSKKNNSTNSIPQFAYVSVFRLNDIEDLKTYMFNTADVDWLHAIVAHRTNRSFPEVKKMLEPYDVISGKIANDNTNATIAAYMENLYGPMGSRQADDFCISLLLPERLQDQFCFRSVKSLGKLEYLTTEKICLDVSNS